MVNYLMQLSRKLAEICTPIYKVSGSKSEWYWGPDQHQAFEDVKKEMSKKPVLCTFDLRAKHRVSADASKNALGAVLLQLADENEWQPVEYASRKISETETRHAMVEKEALAITWACEKFDYYLVGWKFEIESDHKPLISILGEKDLSCLPARVQRFKLRSMRYDYNIFHTAGKDMYLADSLSRPNSDTCGETKSKSDSIEAYVHNIVSSSTHTDVREEAVVSAMANDECENSVFIVAVDYYSKWIEALPVASQAPGAIITVMRELFSRFGIPNIVRSDNGRCFDSKEFRKFAEDQGFSLITSSPRYPCSNGMAESAVKIVKSLWKRSYDKYAALMAYRTTPLPSGFTPSELMFGRAVRCKLGMPYESDIDYGQFEELENSRMKNLKRKWDKKYRVSLLSKLSPGQTVFVRAPTDPRAKCVVLREDNSPDSYWVRVGQSEIRRNRKHLFVLHPER
ncbi:uncharacterized protein [Watersipora subatra]|uniref:uncharacterized protein n=1 Tax=Watersipora subatra TaxID=2589382 RepID=UPI00355B8640